MNTEAEIIQHWIRDVKPRIVVPGFITNKGFEINHYYPNKNHSGMGKNNSLQGLALFFNGIFHAKAQRLAKTQRVFNS